MRSKISSDEIHMARLVLGTLEEVETQISEEVRADITKWGNHDPDVIQALVTRMVNEGTLPEEMHRYLAKGVYEEWAEGRDDNMPREIFNEFPTHNGLVQITGEEFMDILAYVAKEYYG